MTVDAASHDNANTTHLASKGKEYRTRRRRPQVPIDHTRGVVCLGVVPDCTRDQAKAATVPTTRRFLSRRANGLIKLWEVDERPADKGVYGKSGDRKDGSRGRRCSSRAW